MRRTGRVHNLSERMGYRSPSSEKHAKHLLLGVAAALTVGALWVLLSPAPQMGETQGATGAVGVEHEPSTESKAEQQAVLLNPDEFPVIPGKGPLRIAMRYLGEDGESGFANEQIEQTLPGSLSGRVTGVGLVQDPNKEDGTLASPGLEGVVLKIMGGPQDGLSCETDSQGRYRLLDLIPGTHFIQIATPTGGRYLRLQRIKVRGRTLRNFALGMTVDVPLLFRDHKGELLSGATVEMDGRTVQTGEDGVAWVAGAPSGPRVLVQVSAEGHVPVRFELNVLPLRMSNTVEMPALPQGATLRGQVQSWPEGELPRVTVVPRAIRPGAFQVVWETWQEVEVDHNGIFELNNLPTDRMVDVRVFHSAGVAKPRVRALRASVLHSSIVEFTIMRGNARVSGKVLDEEGQPLAGAAVVLKASNPAATLARLYPGLANAPATVRLPVPGAIHREVKTKKDGKFDFAWGDHPKGTGSLLLSVKADGHQISRREIRSGHSDLRIRLKPAIRDARLLLTADDDGPMPEAYVWIVDGEVHETAQPELSDLLPGWYKIAARRGEHDILKKRVYLDGRSELAVR